ncbi:MAG: pyridoxamine 5'-phosphate oxidase family protein [Myxococcales bacterium]
MSNASNDKPDPRAGWSHAEPAFHAGERALQARYGLAERLGEVGRRVVREGMPDQHREFFEEQPFMVVGSLDAALRPWASLLVGEPGFVHTPDATTLDIRAEPRAGDPLADQLELGAKLGMLGIQFETRRRNRVNGHVLAHEIGIGFRLEVEQSFGNCPKYIHRRRAEFRARSDAGPTSHEGARLSAQALELVRRADTFFIASASFDEPGSRDPARGVDVSHRGGPRGFVHVAEDQTGHWLKIPDYSGNYFFNTFGNLLLHPYAGLLFLDFEDGSVLQLTGSTELVLEGPEVEAEPGAERMLHFHVREGRLHARSLDLSFGPER